MEYQQLTLLATAGFGLYVGGQMIYDLYFKPDGVKSTSGKYQDIDISGMVSESDEFKPQEVVSYTSEQITEGQNEDLPEEIIHTPQQTEDIDITYEGGLTPEGLLQTLFQEAENTESPFRHIEFV